MHQPVLEHPDLPKISDSTDVSACHPRILAKPRKSHKKKTLAFMTEATPTNAHWQVSNWDPILISLVRRVHAKSNYIRTLQRSTDDDPTDLISSQ